MLRVALLGVALVAGGCSDDHSGSDGGDGGAGGDQGIPGDLGGDDLAGSTSTDMACTVRTFGGFPSVSATERRLDCPCGCLLDAFNGTMVSGIWNNGGQSNATFSPMANVGLAVTVDNTGSSDGGIGVGALNSLNPADLWYLDGDFDLLVDYALQGPLPRNGQAILQINNQAPPVSSVYTVTRDKNGAGSDEYSAAVAGIQPVTVATSAATGTLELNRKGFVIQAKADGNQVTEFTGAVRDRMAVILTAGLDLCDGPGCKLTVIWHNMRLTSGSLVDRR